MMPKDDEVILSIKSAGGIGRIYDITSDTLTKPQSMIRNAISTASCQPIQKGRIYTLSVITPAAHRLCCPHLL